MRMLPSSIFAVCVLLSISRGNTPAIVPINECGPLVPGINCPILFRDSNGQLWELSNTGGFSVGTTVFVSGLGDPLCTNNCLNAGCLAVSQIGPCVGSTTSYCFGDGSGTPCPCANNSPVGQGRGCLHSFGNGALLGVTGTPSVASDTIVLTGIDMPATSMALYFQGTLTTFSGTVFGDGLRCAEGVVVRLGTTQNSMGQSQYPGPGDLPVSVRGGCSAGDTRVYQLWYRNAATFCTTSTFNLSNAVEILWGN
jgi:hypothetical protein